MALRRVIVIEVVPEAPAWAAPTAVPVTVRTKTPSPGAGVVPPLFTAHARNTRPEASAARFSALVAFEPAAW